MIEHAGIFWGVIWIFTKKGVGGGGNGGVNIKSLGKTLRKLSFPGTKFALKSNNKWKVMEEREVRSKNSFGDTASFCWGVREKMRSRFGEKNLSLTKDGGGVQGGVNDSARRSFKELAGVEEKRNHILLGFSRVFLPVSE